MVSLLWPSATIKPSSDKALRVLDSDRRKAMLEDIAVLTSRRYRKANSVQS